MYKKSILSVLVFAFSFLIGWQVLGVWIEPGSAPPAGNLSTPINIGATAQTKSGNLYILGNVGIGATGSSPVNKLNVGGGMVVGTAYSGYIAPTDGLLVQGKVGIGTTDPDPLTYLHVNGAIKTNESLIVKGAAMPGVSASGEGRIYFDSTDNRLEVSEHAGVYKYLITTASSVFYKQYCCWRCEGGNKTGTPDTCSSTCNNMPACASGDIDYGIHGVMTGGGINSSTVTDISFNNYGYYYRLCSTTNPVYETSCCWHCHVSDTTGKPLSCSHTCVPPSCGSDTDLGVGNIALGGSISAASIATTYAIGYGQSIRNCRKP